MQATYCDLCGKRIVGEITNKEMPIKLSTHIHWDTIDLCANCVEKLAVYCDKLKGDNE